MTMRSEAQKRAQQRYIDKQARIDVRMTPEQRDKIKEHAKRAEESTNAYILGAITSRMFDGDRKAWAEDDKTGRACANALPLDRVEVDPARGYVLQAVRDAGMTEGDAKRILDHLTFDGITPDQANEIYRAFLEKMA